MTPTKIAFYKNVADDYKAALLSNKCRAVIHLENITDKEFWYKVFKQAYPQEEFYFVPYSRTPSGNIGSGSAMCLVYKNFLDLKMGVAIDSDLRYLTQEPEMNAQYFILQTYTYSFENHLCFTDRLNALSKKVCGLENTLFDFSIFLLAYSKEVYPLFLLFLYDLKQPVRALAHKEFQKLLSFPYMTDRIKNNGTCIINELRKRVTSEITRLKSVYPSYNETVEIAKYTPLGLSEENAYLYVRGHDLYDLIAELGEAVCEELKRQEKQRLDTAGKYAQAKAVYSDNKMFKKELMRAALHFTYPEMDKCIKDIQSIWS